MITLSDILRFEVVDNGGGRGRLTDLAVDLLEADYPPITHLHFRGSKRELFKLPWESVTSIDRGRSLVQVDDLGAAVAISSGSHSKAVLLRRDILDSLVLDLQNRRATRANDLYLEEQDGQLLLQAADTSAGAVFRRLSRGHLGRKPSRRPYDWKYVEFLRGDPHGVENGAGYRMRIQRLPPGEIAGLCAAIPYLHAAELLTLLPDPIAADTLEAMQRDRQIQVFLELNEDQALRLLALMAPDDATDLLGRLTPDLTGRFLERLPQERSARLIELLRYPEDTVGGIMTNAFVTIVLDQTIEAARGMLREGLREPDFTHFLYVVESDQTRVLRGVTSMREFVMADDRQQVEEITNPFISTLNPLAPADAAAYRVLNSNLAALPVVGNEGQMLGLVTVDAAVMQVAPESWRSQAPRVFS